ncbi:MAG: hypothetical protein K2K52_02515 [Paramuribaculum sp.]|nr:hypothetical protein [Paramuribaculum sp.]
MKTILLGILTVLTLSACGRSDRSYPRAIAYPRPEIYDSTYRQLIGFPIEFYINSSAQEQAVSETSEASWWDVRYPAYNATLHLSSVALRSGEEEAQLHSRIERMVMNCGGAAVSEEEFYSTDSAYRVLIFYEPGYTPTPVQFVALGNGRLTGGAFSFDDSSVTPDSVAPLLQSVVRDIRYSFLR